MSVCVHAVVLAMWLRVYHCVLGCRSPTPFRRATPRQHCGGSWVWAMPSCSVPLSSSWGACFSWPLPCFSWMTGRKLRNSKWLRHCWRNSSAFHLLFSHLFFKYLQLARDVYHWLKKSKRSTWVHRSGKKKKKSIQIQVLHRQRGEGLYLDIAALVVAGVWCVVTSCPAVPTNVPILQDSERPLESKERSCQLKVLQSWHKLFWPSIC